jgi:tRNA U34 5-carboxymethylaminomethyl modifying enzyme MnmG/GidA
MDKHRRLCKEKHDLYLCEVDILGGLRKTQSAKLRELNEAKANAVSSDRAHNESRSSKKAMRELAVQEELKRL